MSTCPECAEEVLGGQTACPFCGFQLAASAPTAGRRGSHRRALFIVIGLTICSVLALTLTGVLRGVPVPGAKPSAASVYRDLEAAGLPITDGRPADPKFAEMVRENGCAQSRSFVRSDADQGWGFICVGLDREAFERVSSGFESVPALLGGLYADAYSGDVVVVGFGWPDDASELVHKAIGDDQGTFLGPSR